MQIFESVFPSGLILFPPRPAHCWSSVPPESAEAMLLVLSTGPRSTVSAFRRFLFDGFAGDQFAVPAVTALLVPVRTQQHVAVLRNGRRQKADDRAV